MCQLFHTNAQNHQIRQLELLYKKEITYFQTKENTKIENWLKKATKKIKKQKEQELK